MAIERFYGYREWLAIDPGEQPVDHYRLLGIARFESNPAAIRRAVAQQTAVVSAHLAGPQATHAQQLLDHLAAAQSCLLDPHVKAQYDASLRSQANGSLPSTVPMGLPVEAMLPPAAAPDVPQLQQTPETGQDIGQAAATSPVAPQQGEASADESDQLAERQPFYRRVWFAVALLAGAAVGLSMLGAIGLWWLNAASDSTDGDAHRAAPTDDATPSDSPPIDVAPTDVQVIQQQPGGEVLLPAELAATHGADVHIEQRGTDAVVAGWYSIDESISWKFDAKQGTYDLEITYATSEPGGRFQITVDDALNSRPRDVRSQATGGQFVTDSWKLVLQKSGTKELKMQAIMIPGNELLVLKSIRLVPN